MKMYLYKIKQRFKKKIKLIFLIIEIYFNSYFNSVVREQKKDIKKIPIIIISFNQLDYLRKLINFLKKHNYNKIVIIDNNSTYPPLLEYFESLDSSVKIHRLDENLGHLVFWKNIDLLQNYSKGYYVVTDADIVPDDKCPSDFLLYFKKVLDKNYNITKVGFSLNIDDIPNVNKNKKAVIDWEAKFWKFRRLEGGFVADIDTTFALYRPGYKRKNPKLFKKAIRMDYPYNARHGGWYIDTNKLTDEQNFYIKTANYSSSWLIDKEGELINPIFKNVYDNN